jgi:hypothetical protein
MNLETGPFIAEGVQFEARPLRHWKARVTDALCAAVGAKLADWSVDWRVRVQEQPRLDKVPAAEVSIAEDWSEKDFMSPRWQVWQGEGGEAVWWSVARRFSAPAPDAPAAPHQGVREAMYGALGRSTLAGGTIAQQMACEAWRDWCQRLAACFGISLSAQGDSPGEFDLPAEIIRPWSGALALRISCAGMPMLLVPNSQSVQRWSDTQGLTPALPTSDGNRRALVPIAEAVAPCTARLSIELAPVDISLGILASLRNGDVLRTTHRLDTPLRVVGHGDHLRHEGGLVCGAFLGQQGDARVVELLGVTPDQRGG